MPKLEMNSSRDRSSTTRCGCSVAIRVSPVVSASAFAERGDDAAGIHARYLNRQRNHQASHPCARWTRPAAFV